MAAPNQSTDIWFDLQLLRFKPTTPLAIARTVAKTNEYRGYTIPKGTTVMTNIWAALHDERYPDPFEFKPDRFVDKEKNVREGINPLPDIAFGFGRRWVGFLPILASCLL